MSAFDFMKQANLLDWYTLLVGLKRGWCKKEHLIGYAETVLAKTAGEVDGDIVTIASGENLSEDDLISTCIHFLGTHGQPTSQEKECEAMEKWRLAHLSWLLQREGSDEEKVSELQELYAQFGFPDDMASCSIYSSNGIDPLVAASGVVERLSRRFLPEFFMSVGSQ